MRSIAVRPLLSAALVSLSVALFAACPVKGPIGAIHARIRDVLRNVTLAELFRSAPPPRSRRHQSGR